MGVDVKKAANIGAEDVNKADVAVKAADSRHEMHKSLENTYDKFVKNGLKELHAIIENVSHMTQKELKAALEVFMHQKKDPEK